jgi:hypothetical protein
MHTLQHLESALRLTELIKSAAKSGKIYNKEILDKAMKMVEKELSLALEESGS